MTMVLISDVNLEIGANVRSKWCILIYLRHLIKSRAFSEKDLFSLRRAQHVLSYHLISVTWKWRTESLVGPHESFPVPRRPSTRPHSNKRLSTVCPRSLDSYYVVYCCIKWVEPCWTYSMPYTERARIGGHTHFSFRNWTLIPTHSVIAAFFFHCEVRYYKSVKASI